MWYKTGLLDVSEILFTDWPYKPQVLNIIINAHTIKHKLLLYYINYRKLLYTLSKACN